MASNHIVHCRMASRVKLRFRSGARLDCRKRLVKEKVIAHMMAGSLSFHLLFLMTLSSSSSVIGSLGLGMYLKLMSFDLRAF